MKLTWVSLLVGLCCAAVAAPSAVLPSKSYKAAKGDDVVEFKTPLKVEDGAKFGNVVIDFTIDTRYVDLVFCNSEGETLKTSRLIEEDKGTIGLSMTGVIKAAPATQDKGIIVGQIIRKGAKGSTLFTVRLGIAVLGGRPYSGGLDNVLVGGDGKPLKLIVHTDAIARAGGSYQITPGTRSLVRTADGPKGNTPLDITGGKFTIMRKK